MKQIMQQSTLSTAKLVARVSAGPPADISPDLEFIDLNNLLAGDNCVLLQVSGSSMETAINNNDYVIVRRNKAPQAGDIVIASVGGEYTAKVFKPYNNGLHLVPINTAHAQIEAKEDFSVIGVVIWILKKTVQHVWMVVPLL